MVAKPCPHRHIPHLRATGVYVRFPSRDAEAGAVSSAQPFNTMDSEANRILVVDDTPITARWVGYVAGRLGFNAVLAFNGEEALSRLAEQPFAAVISDVEMPGMNGFELLQNIRQFHPAMPVILMSAFWNEERREAAQACAAQGMLQKPINADQLAELFGGRRETRRADPILPAPVLSIGPVNSNHEGRGKLALSA